MGKDHETKKVTMKGQKRVKEVKTGPLWEKGFLNSPEKIELFCVEENCD